MISQEIIPCRFLGISCQNQKSNHLNFNCIYRTSYKIAKKGKPYQIDLPLLKNDITAFELASEH
jgi:hypothetical protein